MKKSQLRKIIVEEIKKLDSTKGKYKFNYKMRFSPYGNSLKADNYDEAWKKLANAYPKYDVKKTAQYLTKN